MTDSERQQILKMIDEGKISAEQGLILIRALDEEPEDDELPELPDAQVPPSFESAPDEAPQPEPTRSDPEFDRKLSRFRSLWVIPLWIGVAITIASAYAMYTALQSSGFGFWFYFTWLPFLLGVALTALGFSSRASRWIYVNVKQRPGQTPQRIVIAFPLSLVSWIMQLVRFNIPTQQAGVVDEVMRAVFDSSKSSEPLLVDVTEENGEHVQVYIG